MSNQRLLQVGRPSRSCREVRTASIHPFLPARPTVAGPGSLVSLLGVMGPKSRRHDTTRAPTFALFILGCGVRHPLAGRLAAAGFAHSLAPPALLGPAVAPSCVRARASTPCTLCISCRRRLRAFLQRAERVSVERGTCARFAPTAAAAVSVPSAAVVGRSRSARPCLATVVIVPPRPELSS